MRLSSKHLAQNLRSTPQKSNFWRGFASGVVLLSACTGHDGANGLTRISEEPAGAHCANGGLKLEAGSDSNRNGTLDADEVETTSYACHGDGTKALSRSGPEEPGLNCPLGGIRIETGLDINGNDVLDADEVTAATTTFVCNLGTNGAVSPSTGINIAIKPNGVVTKPGEPIAVRFTVKDDRGFPIDLALGKAAGTYSVNTPIAPRFSLSYFTTTGGVVSPLSVLTKTGTPPQPTAYNPLGTAPGHGTLVENGFGAGDYTYAFPTETTASGAVAVGYDTTKLDETHVLWIQATRQTDLVFQLNANTAYAANLPYYFVPSGAHESAKREIVTAAACNGCHAKFKAETTTSGVFHGGGRVDGTYCNVCHNPGRVSNPAADSASFVHRIHNGAMTTDANLFHGIRATYPQDVRNCDACHGDAAQGQQIQTNPTQIACKGCHDYVAFDNSASAFCNLAGQIARDSDGRPLPCNHVGGPQPDSACATCHGPGRTFATTRYHNPVVKPDPNNAWLVPGGNANTNAAYMAASGVVPAGADVIAYDVKSVDAVDDAAIAPNKRPQITFKLKRNGSDVVFPPFVPGVTTELMANFVGSPSVYFAFAVPQDGIAKPADFNASASGYIKKIWDSTASGAGAGTMTGPDASGYYTIRLTGVQIPPTATMLTGGLGYTYSLTSAPPLVQTNLQAFPWQPNVPADGKAQGGLIVPAPNVWKVATGFAGRRAIVDVNKCNACHGLLGVSPGGSFHAGQRNDAPTCSFCHTPNRTSAGWAASSKYAIHAIHAGRKRTVPFTWHAAAAGPGYDEVEFPGTLNTCTTCHIPNTFDFTNPSNLAAVQNMELTTVATGKFNSDPLQNSTYFTVSPYVVADNTLDYGPGFAFNAATAAVTEASGTNLVLSPLTAACSACHDSSIAISHMRSNGGVFYGPRATALANGPTEQCLICHGPGRVAAIGQVHQH